MNACITLSLNYVFTDDFQLLLFRSSQSNDTVVYIGLHVHIAKSQVPHNKIPHYFWWRKFWRIIPSCGVTIFAIHEFIKWGPHKYKRNSFQKLKNKPPWFHVLRWLWNMDLSAVYNVRPAWLYKMFQFILKQEISQK